MKYEEIIVFTNFKQNWDGIQGVDPVHVEFTEQSPATYKIPPAILEVAKKELDHLCTYLLLGKYIRVASWSLFHYWCLSTRAIRWKWTCQKKLKGEEILLCKEERCKEEAADDNDIAYGPDDDKNLDHDVDDSMTFWKRYYEIVMMMTIVGMHINVIMMAISGKYGQRDILNISLSSLMAPLGIEPSSSSV